MKLSYFLKEKHLRRRDVLYQEGDPADGIYFIKEGQLEVSIKYKREEIDTLKYKFNLKSNRA